MGGANKKVTMNQHKRINSTGQSEIVSMIKYANQKLTGNKFVNDTPMYAAAATSHHQRKITSINNTQKPFNDFLMSDLDSFKSPQNQPSSGGAFNRILMDNSSQIQSPKVNNKKAKV